VEKKVESASHRINKAFMELLESQFPITDYRSTINPRTPSDFADQLNIHVNHLNRAVKAVNGKTTSIIIKDKILMESKRLLEDGLCSVSEIAHTLGFTEVTHFNNFFKKHTKMNPTQFRASVTEKQDQISDRDKKE
jgi:AraC-like DNA-binding protein